MQHDYGFAIWVARLLHVNLMPVAHIQHAAIKRLDLRIEVIRRASGAVNLSMASLCYPAYMGRARLVEHMESRMQPAESTVDPAEVAKFEAMAAEWWDPNGKFKPLHLMNPCRLDYITTQIAEEFGRNLEKPQPFKGLRLLDIGCGGGLLSEPMARLGGPK